MKKEIVVCDRCGKDGAQTISACVDRVSDAAGSMENEWDSVDLCPDCLYPVVGDLLATLGYEERKDFMREMRKKVAT